MRVKNKSRSENVIINGVLGVANKLFLLSLVFVSRTVFIKTLGANYLGINGLFINILTMLSLAELGIGNVLTFSLYKPLAHNDKQTINRLLTFYKKMYRFLAMGIFLLGTAIIPFLKYIVNLELSNNEVTLFYTIYLVDSAVSYLAVYKSTLFKADQRNYIIDTVNTITTVIASFIQIAILLIWGNFVAYLIVNIVRTLVQNVLLTYLANKYYEIQDNHEVLLDQEKDVIITNVKATFLYKIGQSIINYTDNILISIMLGTVVVGYYSNYSMIVTQVQGFIAILTAAIIASVGNLSTEGDSKKAYTIFKNLVFFFHVVTAFCSLCFLSIFNDFINLWIGSEYVLLYRDVFAITFSFYIQNVINPVWMYREAYGLFKQIRYVMLVTAIVNIIVSIMLGRIWGVGGIIIATGISRILTTVWYEPTILNKAIFHENIFKYYLVQIKYFICTATSYGILVLLTNQFTASLLTICIKVVLSFVIIIVVFSLVNFKSDSYQFWLGKFQGIFKRKR